MRILIDSGSYYCENVGDVAMLQIAIQRLRTLWPDASIGVMTLAPANLRARCPGVAAVPLGGRIAFTSHHFAGRAHAYLPSPVRRGIEAFEERLRDRRPSALAWAVAARLALARREDWRAPRRYVEALAQADLVLLTGAGVFTDAFAENALGVLEILEAASRRNIPTAAVGQGVGPVHEPALLDRMRAVLPLLSLIGLREGAQSAPLLESIGVAPDRLVVTGDDAIELAHAGAPPRIGDGIGVNLRVASYAEVSEPAIEAIRPVLQEAARRLHAPLVPLPIAHHHECADSEAIHSVLRERDSTPDGGAAFDTPEKVIAQVARCRVVVTGSYHAGVFALAQGIPVIGLAGAAYYLQKFHGLAEEFPGSCRVLRLHAPSFPADLADALEQAWAEAPHRRADALRAARRQIARGREAYARLGAIVARRSEGRVHPTAANPEPLTTV